MADLKKFAEELVNLSVKEVTELAKYLKKSMVLNQLQQQSQSLAQLLAARTKN